MQCCSGICLLTPGAFMGAQLKIALRLISIFTLGLIGSAVQAREVARAPRSDAALSGKDTAYLLGVSEQRVSPLVPRAV